MVTRYYICDNCDHYFSIQQPMHDSLKKKCPECGKYKLYQDLTGQHGYVYQEPNTIGHQADRNTSKLGKYERDTKDHEHKAGISQLPKKKSWYNPEGKNLKQELKHLDTKQKKIDYIKSGKL